jgi:hypothetical protein
LQTLVELKDFRIIPSQQGPGLKNGFISVTVSECDSYLAYLSKVRKTQADVSYSFKGGIVTCSTSSECKCRHGHSSTVKIVKPPSPIVA